MLINQEVEVRWVTKTRKHYIEKGYKYTELYDYFMVSVNDLTKGSHVAVDIECDYCGEIFSKPYKAYLSSKKSIAKIDACGKCIGQKTRDGVFQKYGVNSISYLDSVQNKRAETNLKKYGVKSPLQNKDILNKVKKTNLKRYGVDSPLKNKEILKKVQDTNLVRYGFKSSFQNKDVQEKHKQTCMEKYGVPYIFLVPEIMDDIQIKSRQAMIRNGSVPCSRQQEYIFQAVGGKLNHLKGLYFLDIAFSDSKTYIEYDGGGHDLSVKLNNLTEDQFNQKELDRYNYLKNKGWDMIRIISLKDMIPDKAVLIEMLSFAKDNINEWNDYIVFDIDKGIVYSENLHHKYNFGKLSKITKDDLKLA